MNKNQQIERLATEWKKHSHIVIAVDYDDTIFPFRSATQEFCDQVIKLLHLSKLTGAYLMIHTSSNKDRHGEIIQYCNNKGLIIDSINCNPIELPYGKDGKPYANIYLDDRAGLNEALDILETAMYKQRGYLEQQKLLNSELD